MKVGLNKMKYTAMDKDGIYTATPSKKYPQFWWAGKVGKGLWEGFDRPMTLDALERWIETLPASLVWSESKWSGLDEPPPKDSRIHHQKSDTIYFFEAINSGLVKIGITTGSVTGRLLAIASMSPFPLRAAGTMRGFVRQERQIHKRFSHCRSHGEWFHFTSEIKDFIKQNCQ